MGWPLTADAGPHATARQAPIPPLRVQPRALHLLERRLSLRSPAFHVPVPDLPAGLTLTSVEPAPGGFVVRGVLSEWQRSVARDDVERLLAAIRGGKDRLDL